MYIYILCILPIVVVVMISFSTKPVATKALKRIYLIDNHTHQQCTETIIIAIHGHVVLIKFWEDLDCIKYQSFVMIT